jgi:transposase InsO family protein
MPNVLNREFSVTEPSKVWVSDITYIRVKEGFLYLTTVLDLYDRKIIGWSLSSGMSVEETSLAAWRMAIKTEASQRDCYFILTEVFNTPVKNLQTWLILIKSLPVV